jgi:molybdopterin/thiamine biosynthesis adenylyltransferase
MTIRNKYERQERLFGKEGQRRLNNTHVLIIGVGGVGSHVAQQLAYIGVGKISFIDDDKLEDTNLNRLIGVYDSDEVGTPKTKIIERLIKLIDPNITVNEISDNVVSKVGFEALTNANFIFGCVDNDGVRSYINEVAQAFEIPYLDVATGIDPEYIDYGGRVIFVNGEGCLYCFNEIDHEEVRTYFENPEAQKDRKEIYGIKNEDLEDSGPSVVNLNGVLASLATVEFMVYITGLRKPKKFLAYNGKMGSLNNRIDNPNGGCYYCNTLRGSHTTSYNFN